ncbi:hypothetical protein SAMN05421858_3918 [Haladaptatus litoreus]|uniref:Uncharacterized protein n=1 Tax=Haladaptatus litoreus TaxID=553468 RepID=A0A1N7E0U5_9EURY|nr:hypothetical protein SAMN05421858_3918 [Haladaptatus litoreus]
MYRQPNDASTVGIALVFNPISQITLIFYTAENERTLPESQPTDEREVAYIISDKQI